MKETVGMCGRYVFTLRPSVVRQRLADLDMPVDEAPDDNDELIRQSYNFAPTYHGLIYRAATSDRGTDATPLEEGNDDNEEPSPKKVKLSSSPHTRESTKFKLQAAKWGLVPFWTKRPPEVSCTMRTINCRDDSLIENRGMWNIVKQRKRCVVIAEGFYEWLKKNNGKERIPYFTKRTDEQLMCFAGLWDCVQYEDSDDKLYTYTIITTDSNKQLKFLHDRMPVILEPGSEAMRLWLDPSNAGWNKDLQRILKPFDGELECYPVDKAVGKVGNNSPSFVVPIDSKENKNNIANFFQNQGVKKEKNPSQGIDDRIKKEPDEHLDTTVKVEDPESNAPLPKPETTSEDDISQAIEKDVADLDDATMIEAADDLVERHIQREMSELDDEDLLEAEKSPPRHVWSSPSAKTKRPATPPLRFQPNETQPSPLKKSRLATEQATPGDKTRSAMSNHSSPKTPTKKKKEERNAKITSFFTK